MTTLATRTDHSHDIAIVRSVLSRAQVKCHGGHAEELATAARKVVALDGDMSPAGDLEQEFKLSEFYKLVAEVAPAWVGSEIIRCVRDGVVPGGVKTEPEKTSPPFWLILLVTAVVLAVGFVAVAWFAGKPLYGTGLGVWVGCEP